MNYVTGSQTLTQTNTEDGTATFEYSDGSYEHTRTESVAGTFAGNPGFGGMYDLEYAGIQYGPGFVAGNGVAFGYNYD